MRSVITNVAGITILPLKDYTHKVGGGAVSIGATAVLASKGLPGVVHAVTRQTWEQVFGIPLPKNATGMEGLRHLDDALEECDYCNVVRVVGSDARFPDISIKFVADKGSWAQETDYAVGDVVEITGGDKLRCIQAHTSGTAEPTGPDTNWEAYADPSETGNQAYGTAITVGDGYLLSVYPVDGDPSTERKFEIVSLVADKGAWAQETAYAKGDLATLSTGEKLLCIKSHTSGTTEPTAASPRPYWKVFAQADKRFKINFYGPEDTNRLDTFSAGDTSETPVETHIVGVSTSDKDAMGRSAFIETVLEEQSNRFRAVFNADYGWDDIQFALSEMDSKKVAFSGGTNGSEPTTEEWKDAWSLFENEGIPAYLMFAAGNYDEEVIAHVMGIARTRHVNFFFDIDPRKTPAQAIDWLLEAGVENRQSAVYYSQFAANDSWYGGKTIWGVSGAAVAACARGNKNYSGAVPGVHYSPAGEKRAKLSRTGATHIHPNNPITDPIREEFYEARINPVIPGANGGAVIDDALSLHYESNYSRFVWVNRIGNYIVHLFHEGAQQLKHEPDGITYRGLDRLMKNILEPMVTAEALSSPREDGYGTEPYTYEIVQNEIDLWTVTWSFCPTGSARRIAGQPRLIP